MSFLGHKIFADGVAAERFQHVCVDLVGKLPVSEGYQYLFTAVDRYTRFVQGIPLEDASADSVCSAFLHSWIAYMRVSVLLQSDHESCFEELVGGTGLEKCFE